MQCVKAGGMQNYSCGQCMPCRIDKRRMWTHRILLETRSHPVSTFITLTYKDMPRDNSVHHEELSLWIKRIRKAYPHALRHYSVGEYGDLSQRPHYHVVLFGFPNCAYGRTPAHARRLGVSCCRYCDLVKSTWKLGGIELGQLNATSAGYIAGYTTKKMTKQEDPRLLGRRPEFARMSLKPGIGALEIRKIADTLLAKPELYEYFFAQGDLPASLKVEGRDLPLGRYLRERLHEELEFGKEAAKKIRTDRIEKEMQAVSSDPQRLQKFLKENRLEHVPHETRLQKARNLEARLKINQSKKQI